MAAGTNGSEEHRGMGTAAAGGTTGTEVAFKYRHRLRQVGSRQRGASTVAASVAIFALLAGNGQ